MPPQVFTGRHPFGELTTPVITSKTMDGGRPARPQEAQGLGLTGLMWDMTVHYWHQDPVQRPTMTEVVQLTREWPVLSVEMVNVPDQVDAADIRSGSRVKPLYWSYEYIRNIIGPV